MDEMKSMNHHNCKLSQAITTTTNPRAGTGGGNYRGVRAAPRRLNTIIWDWQFENIMWSTWKSLKLQPRS